MTSAKLPVSSAALPLWVGAEVSLSVADDEVRRVAVRVEVLSEEVVVPLVMVVVLPVTREVRLVTVVVTVSSEVVAVLVTVVVSVTVEVVAALLSSLVVGETVPPVTVIRPLKLESPPWMISRAKSSPDSVGVHSKLPPVAAVEGRC